VKVIAPVVENDVEAAVQAARRFVSDSFPHVSGALPN
jgi:hypothetical protein